MSIITSAPFGPERIPRTIHYCWFSGEPMSVFVSKCIATWTRVMPDYRLRAWTAKSFDFGSFPFIREAFAAKKWAFVADYIRLYALYTEGGIYLDSDVKVKKPFDDFLHYTFFTSHELHPYNFTQQERQKLDQNGVPLNPTTYIYGLNVQAAIMGAAPGCSFLRACLEFYKDKHFLDTNGRPRCDDFVIGPHLSKIAEQYGYRYMPERQQLKDNMVIFEPELFVGNSAFFTRRSYAIHLCHGTWRDKSPYATLRYTITNRWPASHLAFRTLERTSRALARPVRLLHSLIARP